MAISKEVKYPTLYLVMSSLTFSALIGANPLNKSWGIGFLNAPTWTLYTKPSGNFGFTGIGFSFE